MNPLHGNVPWDSVTVLRKKPKAPTNKKVAVNQAQQSGESVVTEKKFNAATNKHPVTSLNTAKLDAETEKLSHNKVGLDVGRLIQQGRSTKGWNRQEFATKICEKVQVVNEYELGTALPNQQILAKMERAIGVKLRGKDKGKPMAPPEKSSGSSTATKPGTSKAAAKGKGK